MARGSRLLDVSDFRAGLNVAVPASGLDPGEASYVMNLLCDQHGALVSRGSQHVVMSLSSSTLDSLATVEHDEGSGNARIIYSTAAGKLGIYNSGAAVVNFPTAMTANSPWVFKRMPVISGRGPYYGMNGVDTPQYIDAAQTLHNWTAVTGTVPNGKFMIYAENRLYVAGVASDPNAVYWSEVGDPTNWPPENVTRFGVDDGLPITGLGTVGSYLLVFKANAIWRIYDLDTSANTKIAGDAGTSSPRSVVDAGGVCFFLDRRKGFCETDGTTVRPISDKVLPLAQYMATSGAALGRNVPAVAVHVDHTLYVSGVLDDGTYGYSSGTLAYDTRTGAWWVLDHAPAALTTVTDNRTPYLYSAQGADLSYILSNVGPASIPWTWRGGQQFLGPPQVATRVREMLVRGQATVDVAVMTNFGDDVTNEAGLVVDGEASLYSLGVSPTWQPSFSGNGWHSRIEGYSFAYDVRKGKG